MGKNRWCLLKRPENLTDKQVDKLSDLLACNLNTIRAYLLKEDFQRFWNWLGRDLSRRVVCQDHAFAAQTDEESGEDVKSTSTISA